MTNAGRAVAGALGVTAAAGLATLAWGVVVERNRFTVRHETLAVLEPDARPITILHLSDMHMAPWQRMKQDFIRSLAVYEPDLVIDTGDNLGHMDGLEGVRRALEPFAGAAGVFAHGSNDHFGPMFKNPFGYFLKSSGRVAKREADLDTAALNSFLHDELGWLDLNNRVHAVEIKGTRIEFMGTRDAHRGWDRLGELPGAVEEMRENVEWSSDEPRQVLTIGVTHAPYRRVLDAFVSQGPTSSSPATPTAARSASPVAPPSWRTATSRTRRRRVCRCGGRAPAAPSSRCRRVSARRSTRRCASRARRRRSS
ncbi:hypothetical protein GCM10025869_06670 [Homoserinibacter gongjuensis]|uniref:Calcineurin-like phosphoesterase domain-containing protein n=1 Tax=Homoserinibacter gongjuensis TaxID=1162968 RepID=A0ABQ6JRV6_9MICO|nr:hypothetical protein GCM10025869_06670 [Homoserinibacter gongjuensis]